MDEFRERISNKLRIEDNKLVRELLAEAIGTFFLLVSNNLSENKDDAD